MTSAAEVCYYYSMFTAAEHDYYKIAAWRFFMKNIVLAAEKALLANDDTPVLPALVLPLSAATAEGCVKFRKNQIRAANARTAAELAAARAAAEKDKDGKAHIKLPRATAKRPAVGYYRLMTKLQQDIRKWYSAPSPAAAAAIEGRDEREDALRRAYGIIGDGVDVVMAVCEFFMEHKNMRLGDIITATGRGGKPEQITVRKGAYRAAQAAIEKMRGYTVRAADIDLSAKYAAPVDFITPAAKARQSETACRYYDDCIVLMALSRREREYLSLRINGVSLMNICDIMSLPRGSINAIRGRVKSKCANFAYTQQNNATNYKLARAVRHFARRVLEVLE